MRFVGFFKDVVVDTVGAVGADMIGDQFHGKKINAFSHKLAHAFLGGTMGYVLEGKDGVTPGAVSSVLSETLMEELTPKQALGQSDEEYLKVVERTSAMVRMITASTALLLRQDMALMDRIGTNAIENNFMRHLDDVVELDEDDPIWQMDKEEALKELQARHEMLGRDGGDVVEYVQKDPDGLVEIAVSLATRGGGKVGGAKGVKGTTKIVVEDAPMMERVLNPRQQSHLPIKAPETLPAFPDATYVKPKSFVQGGGNLRKRWVTKNRILEWDSRHGTVEVYNRQGTQHLGEFDPQTGKQLKPADPTRKTIK